MNVWYSFSAPEAKNLVATPTLGFELQAEDEDEDDEVLDIESARLLASMARVLSASSLGTSYTAP
jgi:hypothetical protein